MSIEPSPEGPSFALRDSLEPVTVEPPVTTRTGHEVPKVRTPLTDEQIRGALDAGHVLAFGVSPSVNRLDVATAQVIFETGHGTALWDGNFGNIDCTKEWEGACFPLTANEGSGATTHALRKMLRAYDTAVDGAAGYWRYLADHHATALASFDAGDGAASVRLLKKSGYFSGDVEAYASGVASLVRETRMKRGATSDRTGTP